MKKEFQVPSSKFQVPRRNLKAAGLRSYSIQNSKFKIQNCRAFTIVEMLVTLVLLSLIVLALMAVFNSTQNAFRASLTETDILESGRMAMGLIADDLEKMTPSYGTNTVSYPFLSAKDYYPLSPVNFYVNANPINFANPNHHPLVQYLPGTSAQRTNVLENFFILSRQNINGSPTWVGTGYAVDPSSYPTNSLYRFTMTTNVINGNPLGLFNYFVYPLGSGLAGYRGDTFTNTALWSHLLDGVVGLTVRAYDPDGFWMTSATNVYYSQTNIYLNTFFFAPLSPTFNTNALPVYGVYMYSNTVPASVEVKMAVLENNALEHAEGLPDAPPVYAQTAYLSNRVNQLHLFRQRVWIRNVDPAAYQ